MIREATHDDLPSLLALGARMHAESPRFSRLTFSGARLRQTLAALIDSPQGFLWVGVFDDMVVGGMAGIAAPHWASDDLVASDLALFIHPDFRGGMLPVRLVNRYLWWARTEVKATLRQLGITTGVHTETTARLYERMGLTRCGVLLEDQHVL